VPADRRASEIYFSLLKPSSIVLFSDFGFNPAAFASISNSEILTKQAAAKLAHNSRSPHGGDRSKIAIQRPNQFDREFRGLALTR
jgi:hypothetical protein